MTIEAILGSGSNLACSLPPSLTLTRRYPYGMRVGPHQCRLERSGAASGIAHHFLEDLPAVRASALGLFDVLSDHPVAVLLRKFPQLPSLRRPEAQETESYERITPCRKSHWEPRRQSRISDP